MTRTQARRNLPRGKKPAQLARPHLKLASGIAAPLPTPPVSVMYDRVTDWGMEGNDGAGDCVEAYIAHAVEQITSYVSGTEQVIPTDSTIGLYSAMTDYDPSQTDADGNNPTDQGTNMQDALTYWRKTGVFNGHKIAAFAAVNLTDWDEIENAIDWFGHLAIGFNFPDSAMDQFNAGEPWTVVPDSPYDGAHCVMAIGYDADWIYVVTWGAVQKMDRKFWAANVDEAWAPITQETITAQGANAFGGILNLAALGQRFADLTSDPNPFPDPDPEPTPTPVPDPTPTPTPVPDPEPSPAPVTDPADVTFYSSRPFQRMLHHHDFADHDLRHVAREWVAEKQLAD